MKRLVWLLLAVFGAAMIQVQPVAGSAAKPQPCDCCRLPGPCEMPCCPPPAALPAVFASAPSVQVVNSPVRRKTLLLCGAVKTFYGSWVEAVATCPALFACAESAPAARVPLFEAHCRFLI